MGVPESRFHASRIRDRAGPGQYTGTTDRHARHRDPGPGHGGGPARVAPHGATRHAGRMMAATGRPEPGATQSVPMSLRLLLVLLLGAAVPVAVAAGFRAEFLAASRAPMDNPHDLKLSPDGRYLFVSDVGNDRVLALDPDSLEALGSFGDDHQDGTHDIDFDAEGRMHVADTHNGRVTIYDMDGLQATLAGVLSDRIRGPEGVLVHPNGRVYVAGAWSGNVVAYAAGDVVAELGGLSAPHDLELAPGGDIWLADAGNDRMLLLSPQLEIRRELKGPPWDFNGVRYQDVLADGTLIAADKYNHQVKVIAADGALIAVLGDGRPGQGPGQFRTPEGIEVRGDILWIADSGNDRVLKYRLQWGD